MSLIALNWLTDNSCYKYKVSISGGDDDADSEYDLESIDDKLMLERIRAAFHHESLSEYSLCRWKWVNMKCGSDDKRS